MLGLVVRFEKRALWFPLPDAGTERTLGSSPESDLVVRFPGVSRLHARVVASGGGVLVRDAGARNGLVVDGRRVREVALEPGRTVRVGRAVLGLEEASTSDLETALAFAPAGAAEGSETASGSAEAEPAGEALAVVRRIEQLSARAFAARRRELLAAAREALRAGALALGELDAEGDAVILAVEGSGLEDAELAAAAAGLAARPGDGGPLRMRLAAGGELLAARRGRQAALALFPEVAEGWQADFLVYVASRFLRPPGPGVEPDFAGEAAAVTAGDLRFPAGMLPGHSPAMRELLAQLSAVVKGRQSVLLLGETGVGKEVVARVLHENGPSRGGPFVTISCAEIPSELLEAELFGVHARVATGVDPRPGLLAEADGGTVLLDEVGELAERLQAKLLRFLQERELRPLGARTVRKVDVRVLSATNRDLAADVGAGRFRADLYYRLAGIRLRVPPLRERAGDIPSLVVAFAERAAAELGKVVHGVSRRALAQLVAHPWPGNVRQLRGEVERAVLVCPAGGTLRAEHFELPGAVAVPPPAASAGSPGKPTLRLDGRLRHEEERALRDALAASGGSKAKAARLLGVTRTALYAKLARLGLTRR